MRTYSIKHFAVFLLLQAISLQVQGQSGIGHSPVSRIGTGLPLDFGMNRNEAMAGCGQAVPEEDFPNFQNPALLHFNRKVNLNMDFRYLYRNLELNGESTYRRGTAGPALLSMVIPISDRISAGFGIRPATFREFTFQNIRYTSADSIGLRIRGSGGLSQAFMSFGIRIFKNLSIGAEGSYLFGTLEDSVTFGVLPAAQNYTFSNIQKRRAGQFLFRPAIHLMQPLNKSKQIFLAAGMSADLIQNVKILKYNRFAIPGSNFADTLESDAPGKLHRPAIVKAGFGIFSPQSWSVSAETEYAIANQIPSEGNIRFSNSLSWRAGAEYRPGTAKSTAYLNLVTYRAGISLMNYPFSDAITRYSDLRFTAGASFPIILKEAKFSRPLINLCLATGARGSSASYFGKERYLMIQLGFTLNDFLWFNRYKID